MATLSADAKRVAGIVDEIASLNHTISYLEYEICDVLDDEYEIKDKQDEQRRYQKQVNEIEDDLMFDDDCVIDYDGKVTQVRRNDVLWLEYCPDYGWIEHEPSEAVQAVINGTLDGGIIEAL